MAKIAPRPQSHKTRNGKAMRRDDFDGPRRPRNEVYNRASFRSAAQRGNWED